MATMIKINVTDNNGNYEFAYNEQTTVNNIREFVAEKLKCKATELDVRKRGQGAYLTTIKTLQDQNITETDTLVVGKTKNTFRKGQLINFWQEQLKILENMIKAKF